MSQNLIYIAKYVYLVGGIIIVLIGILTILGDSTKPARPVANNTGSVKKEFSNEFDNISGVPNEFRKSPDKIAREGCNGTRICSIIPGRIINRLLKIQPITLGLIMGLLPCAPLLAVLSYIGLVSFAWQQCLFYSLIFGLGTLVSPLILLVLGAGAIPKILFNKPKTYRIFRLICGFIIVIFGAQLIFRLF